MLVLDGFMLPILFDLYVCLLGVQELPERGFSSRSCCLLLSCGAFLFMGMIVSLYVIELRDAQLTVALCSLPISFISYSSVARVPRVPRYSWTLDLETSEQHRNASRTHRP